MKEKQELHCHACNQYVQFEINLALNGNHILPCPNCGHEHCRVVRNGRVTGERWDSRNLSYYISSATSTSTSTYDSTSAGDYNLYQSWMGATSSANYGSTSTY